MYVCMVLCNCIASIVLCIELLGGGMGDNRSCMIEHSVEGGLFIL